MRLQNMLPPALKARWGGAGAPAPDAGSVKAAELRTILGGGLRGDPVEVEAWGLALSGGGIRSATFGLGVLQALARNGLLKCFHYQSTVSGGGYIGAFLQALIRRHGFERAFRTLAPRGDHDRPEEGSPGTRPIRHLREYSNYLSPRKSPFSGDTLGMVGTYARNVLLVQVQLCALILALCLLPLLLYAGADEVTRRNPTLLLSLAGLTGMLAIVLLAYVSTYANRRTQPAAGEMPPPPRRVVLAALATIVALAVASMLGALGLARFERLPGLFASALGWLPRAWTEGFELGIVTAALYLLVWHAWLLLDPWYSRLVATGDAPPPALQRHPWRFVLATVGAAAFAGVAIMLLRGWLSGWQAVGSLWHILAFGPPLVVAVVVLTAIVHLGLAGPAMSDLQREIWARVGGKTCALVALGMTLTLGLTIYGPWLMRYGAGQGAQALSGAGWAGVLAWVSTTGIGLLVAHGKRDGSERSKRSRLLDLVARTAPWVFLLGLLIALSLAGHVLLQAAGPALERFAGGAAPTPATFESERLADYLVRLHGAVTSYPRALLLLILGALALWLLFGWAVNVNEFSLNAFYRNRLVRCYLGASNDHRNPEPTTNFDVQDDLVLADLVEVVRHDGTRPLYPLVGTALNMVAAKQLDWQDRKAASFCLTPGWCGYLPPDSRAGDAPIGDRAAATAGTASAAPGGAHVDSLAASLTLGSAIAISGAAVNPNMGYHSSPAVTFLLTLFDARLGWWLPNPRHPEHPRADSSPFFGRWLLAEMLGRTHAGGKFVHLSDGGHFENLGLYELVRRRCRFILCVDAAADADRAFADLGNAVHKCRVDFGADIDIDVAALAARDGALAERSCAVGRITYADGSVGTLLYLKPTLTGEEPADIAHYARSHHCFPHEPTSDQFFDEAQFESYRRLGEDIAQRALDPALERIDAAPGSPGHDQLGLYDSALKDKLLIALRQRWVAPLPGVADRFALHGKALTRLFGKLRDTPALAVLDAQFYPAWTDLVEGTSSRADAAPPSALERRTRLPPPEDFRTCFYFCQELIRLMEAVYHDLDLEHAWDHPDNRGWLNAFRHWSWAPMFRIAWIVGAPSLGARFVAFCQQRLDLPRLDNDGEDRRRVLRLERHQVPPDGDWQGLCDTLMSAGTINHVEHSILSSDPVCKHAVRPTHLYVLRLKWSAVLARTGTDMADSTLGVAAMAEGTLRLLRVQDHVRRLGLATEFMRLLINREVVSEVDIRSGYYGLGGVCRNRRAQQVQAWLEQALTLARKRQSARNDAARAKREARRTRRQSPPPAPVE
ncbi:patatin-like phospholipase family protein [Luteimonas saliphila]|uniref:patatin-like phospholipase family protein n=1 Tax=Luteimonas saliphila TaxID=2804919 RepID=UPI00192DFAAC|nr:patatin-like phospholipase family protein [Luteimonas saliphila]